jgi:hypothetical protein
MEDTMIQSKEDDRSAVVIPRAVFWGLVVPLIFGMCSGSFYMAVLSTTLSTQGNTQTALAMRISALEGRVDSNKDTSTAKVDDINSRLTRMEAQLQFLVKTSEAKK